MRTRWTVIVVVVMLCGMVTGVGVRADTPPVKVQGVNLATLTIYNDPSYQPNFDVDCGIPAPIECQLWATRNGNDISTEVLVANIHGTATGGRAPGYLYYIGIPFPDGCLNARLYATGNHTASGFLVGANIGFGCNSGPDGFGTGKAVLVPPYTPFLAGGPLAFFDSGDLVNVDVAQIWVQEPTGGDGTCAGTTYGPEVLLVQNTSGGMLVPNAGGGPYRYHIYFGTEHKVETAPAICGFTGVTLAFDPTGSGRLTFNTAFSGANGLVCVYGPSIPGSSATNQTPFTFNSKGWSPVPIPVPFQRIGAGTNTYTLRQGVTTDASGAPTANACMTGTVIKTTLVTT